MARMARHSAHGPGDPAARRALGELWLRLLDAAVTAQARRRRPGMHPARALLAARRGFDRAAATVSLVDRLLPGSAGALARRLTSAAPLALAATAIEPLDFGSGTTVFRLATPAGPRVLKVFRRSLGRPLGEQRAVAAHYAGRHRTVSGWYAEVAGLVAPSAYLILPGPILGRPVAAVVQPFLAGRRRCFFGDLDSAEALGLLSADPALAQQFRGFGRVTLECWRRGERCLDLVGRENLMLVETEGRARLAIVDCGVFELPAVRREAPARYAALGERIAGLESLLARLGPGEREGART
jgi:hypothetical protein